MIKQETENRYLQKKTAGGIKIRSINRNLSNLEEVKATYTENKKLYMFGIFLPNNRFL